MRRLFWSTASCALLLALTPALCLAQGVQPPTPAEAEAALHPPPPGLSHAQLDQLLAPIALYPDQLLIELLMAATFPQQVVEAAQWLQDPNNAALRGDDLVAALQPLPWDASVKSLVAFPQIVAMMNDHLDWTEALGAAFASQQVATLARVQFLRERAAAAGELKTTSQIVVRYEGDEILIEPANPDEIYVPVYNPAVVYGTWPDQDYPPVYVPPPPDFYSGEIGAGIAFSVGLGVVAPLWGWGHADWRSHHVVVDPQRYNRIVGAAGVPNAVSIQNNTWRRTAPVATVPAPQRPSPPAGGGFVPPPGTVAPGAIRPPGAGGAPSPPGAGGQPPHVPSPPSAPPGAGGQPPHAPPPPSAPPGAGGQPPHVPPPPSAPPGAGGQPPHIPSPPSAPPPPAAHAPPPPPAAHAPPPPPAAHGPPPPPAGHPPPPPGGRPPPKPGEEQRPDQPPPPPH